MLLRIQKFLAICGREPRIMKQQVLGKYCRPDSILNSLISEIKGLDKLEKYFLRSPTSETKEFDKRL